jgi:ADP-heptose:LPS heptosyltransferase
MNANSIRFADRWLGLPACAVLTLFRRLFDRRRPTGPVKRILFLKLVEQGATVLAYPALRAAAEKVGRENVYFMVLAENRPILDLLDVVPPENVVVVPTGGLVKTLRGMLGALLRIRSARIDAVIDYELFSRASAVLAYVSGAPRRIGYHSYHGDGPWRGDLMTHRLVCNPHLHMQTVMSLMVEAVGRDPRDLPALDLDIRSLDADLKRFVPSAAEADEVRGIILAASGASDAGPLVLLNANASDLLPLRKWDSDRYVELARRLLPTHPELRIAFTGAPSEAAAAKALVRKVGDPRCFSLAGKTTMRQLIVLYTLADLLVTNDSGPAHFASLTGIDVITLFGPETPAVFGVRGPLSHILHAGLPCSPCVNAANNRLSACRNNLCMQAITVDRVEGTAQRVLAERRERLATAN